MNLLSLKTILIVLVGIAVLLMVRPASAADSKPFLIGVTIPKSGGAAQFGPLIESGMNVAVAQINQNGGILGRKVELVVRDSASNAQRAVLAAKDLVEEQKVDFLFPEIVSGLALAVLPYTTENKIITITDASAPKIGDAAAYPYSFQFGDLANKRAPAMGSAIKKLGGKKVGILVGDNPGTIANGDQLAAELPAKFGMEVVGKKVFAVDAKDLTANLQALKDAGADTIAFDAPTRDGIRAVMTGMQTLGWSAKVVSGVAALSGDLKELVPEPVRGQFFAINYRVGTITGPTSPELQQFIDALKKSGPITNIAFPAIARDILYMVKWSYEKAAKEKGAATPDNVKAELESIGTAADYLPQYSFVLGNPHWTSTDHSTANVDYSKLWGLVRVSTPIDGRYEGEELIAQ
jgi:branched-chain amino acid transport system substrate-binding protein